MGVKPIRRTYRLETPSPRPVTGRGRPQPLGASRRPEGVNFAVFGRHATAVSLVLFRPRGLRGEIRLDPQRNRTGDVWHVLVEGAPGATLEYAWRFDGPHDTRAGHRFRRTRLLVDPYARVVAGAEAWQQTELDATPGPLERLVRPRRSVLNEDDFDWGDDRPPAIHLADSVIYELHVRGFTRHASSGVPDPGTFRGVIDKIPYLRDLGVTAVELMPVTEFEENLNPRIDPETGKRLWNFWGYDPIGFFALKSSYASTPQGGGPIREFRRMVRALHAAGIEVILDMVFNHTGEGDAAGPTVSLRGLDNAVYYMLDPDSGEYLDFTGCGNTVNCNHPVVRDLIVDALRYWVTEMHVDGFRFDLASILARGTDGAALPDPPLLERIAADPVLAGAKLIAEAWDASGLYQVGAFPHWGRWAEWNGHFRDDVRRFVRGDAGMVPRLATRLAGSSDLYHEVDRGPYHGVNFVTCHDGFTLADLVSYENKHNERNGEGNADGNPVNFSWNCGFEGPSPSPEVNRLRRRQMKNLIALLMMSQGVPMILAGDELGRTQHGNNNAWCHDGPLSWIDWGLLERNRDMFRFVRGMIRFRREYPLLRRREFFEDGTGEVLWHGLHPGRPDWSDEARMLGMQLVDERRRQELLLLAHAAPAGALVELPACRISRRWTRFVDTRLRPPDEIVEQRPRPELPEQRTYPLGAHSLVILVGE